MTSDHTSDNMSFSQRMVKRGCDAYLLDSESTCHKCKDDWYKQFRLAGCILKTESAYLEMFITK